MLEAARASKGAGVALALAEAHVAVPIFPPEADFDDSGGDDSPCNNGAAIVSLMIDGKHLVFPSDAGVSGINAAFDFLDREKRTEVWPKLFVLPHHGSRHNLDLQTIGRVLGGHWDRQFGTSIASVSVESDNPSPRVVNAVGRRGYSVIETRGSTICHHSPDAPSRGWTAATVLPPLAETDLYD